MKNKYCENCGVHKDMHAGVGCKTFVPPKEANPAAVALGQMKSAAKSKAARENGKLGGRPRKPKRVARRANESKLSHGGGES